MTQDSTKADFNLSAEVSKLILLLKGYPLLIVGLLLLVIPTFYDMNRTIWQTPDQGHGPFILLIILWLLWRGAEARGVDDLQLKGEINNKPWLGYAAVVISGLFYAFGRSQEVWLFEVGAFIPLLAGVIYTLHGIEGLKRYGFAIAFIVFLIPLPGFILDALTSGLKAEVSRWAEVILYQAGYPVARSGVLLTVGQYQLLVADACSGMNSLFSLFALGVLFIHLNKYGFSARAWILFLLITPIAFVANVVRVMILILVTYHMGDEAGQGFIHGFAGLVVFAVALIGFFIVDAILGRIFVGKSHAKN